MKSIVSPIRDISVRNTLELSIWKSRELTEILLPSFLSHRDRPLPPPNVLIVFFTKE